MRRQIGWPAVILLLVACSSARAQDERYLCEPSSQTREALRSVPAARDYTQTFEQRLAALRQLVKRYPHNIFVHRRYQDAFRYRLHLADEINRALELYTDGQDDPVMTHLHARLLMTWNQREAKEELNAVMEPAPSFPWPHLLLAEMATHPASRDPARAERHVRTFIGACPASIEPYAYFDVVQDSEMIQDGSVRLRELLESSTELDKLSFYRHLWDLELRASEAERRDEVRARIRGDLEKLLRLAPHAGEEWFWLSKHGSELAGDEGLRDRLEEAVLKKHPHSEAALAITMDRWRRENPPPGPSASRDEREKYQRANYETLRKWQKRWPGQPHWVSQRFNVARVLPDLATDELLTAIDDWLQMLELHPDYSVSNPPPAIIAAESFVQRKVRLDQVEQLVYRGLRDIEKQQTYRPHPDMFPKDLPRPHMDNVAFTYWRGRIVLTDMYLETQEFEKARGVLSLLAAELERVRPADSAPLRVKNQHLPHEREYLERCARLAELTGDKDTALKEYQAALRSLPREVIEGEKLPLVAAAKRLYLEHGGAQARWIEWTTASSMQPENPERQPPRFTKPLSDFQVTDL